jgi:hypothetical protein
MEKGKAAKKKTALILLRWFESPDGLVYVINHDLSKPEQLTCVAPSMRA